MKPINTDAAPTYTIPFNQAMQHGDFIFVSGSVGCPNHDEPIPPAEVGDHIAGMDVREQTEQTLKNIDAILNEAGASMDDVVKTTILFADANDFNDINEVYRSYMNEPYPARSAFGVELAAEMDVEIEMIAKAP